MKKIISFLIVLVVSVSALSLTVFADFSAENSADVITKDISNIVNEYKSYRNGDITSEQFQSAVRSSCTRLGLDAAVISAASASEAYRLFIGALTDKGIAVNEMWRDFFLKNGDSSGNNAPTPSVDMKGFGACLDYVNGYEVYYGDVGYITRVVGDTYYISLYGRHAEFYQNGELLKRTDSFFSLQRNKNALVLYGDWRFGTRDDSIPADDFTTNIVYNYPSLDEQDDDTLKDFLDDLINKLKMQYPDLSTLQGILSAILSQCNSINGKICTAAEIQELINNAIAQLQGLGGDGGGDISNENTQLIIAALENLKCEFDNDKFIESLENLIGMNGNYNEISRMELVEYSFREKTGFITDLRNICESAVSAYTHTGESVGFDVVFNGTSYNVNFDIFDSFMPAIRSMVAVFIYITFAWNTYRKIPQYISGGGGDNV